MRPWKNFIRLLPWVLAFLVLVVFSRLNLEGRMRRFQGRTYQDLGWPFLAARIPDEKFQTWAAKVFFDRQTQWSSIGVGLDTGVLLALVVGSFRATSRMVRMDWKYRFRLATLLSITTLVALMIGFFRFETDLWSWLAARWNGDSILSGEGLLTRPWFVIVTAAIGTLAIFVEILIGSAWWMGKLGGRTGPKSDTAV